MLPVLKSQIIKLIAAYILALFLLLSLLTQIGRASNQYQTIPTMPPTAAVSSTSTPSDPPTEPSHPTTTSTQPIHVPPSQTAAVTARATIRVITPIPSSTPSATGLSGGSTVPVLTITLTPTKVTEVSPTLSPVPVETAGSSGVLCGLIWGGIVLLLAIGVWWLKSRKK